jgi:uncharacterized protein YndB with AHSA1/START domain
MTDTPRFALTLDRLIDVPREKLYRCWTDAELMKPWFCPKPWYVSHVEIDVRPGGSNLIVMNGPNGEEMPNRGIYLEVVENGKARLHGCLHQRLGTVRKAVLHLRSHLRR